MIDKFVTITMGVVMLVCALGIVSMIGLLIWLLATQGVVMRTVC